MPPNPRRLAAAVVIVTLSCSHVPARAGGAPDGKKLFGEKGCMACHMVGAPSQGPGPELTQVAYQRSAAWLRTWLADPQKVKPGTQMPKLPLTTKEADALIEYLLAAKRPIPAADSTNGEKLFADYQCSACHRVHGKGGKPQFPDLAQEPKDHDATFLDRWLQNPSAVKPGTFMATFPLTTAQRHALVAYIVSLNSKK